MLGMAFSQCNSKSLETVILVSLKIQESEMALNFGRFFLNAWGTEGKKESVTLKDVKGTGSHSPQEIRPYYALLTV